ncbi:MAG TPA: hypothetical protein VD788_04270 [Candidatus Polarisedimenticolaceae bacterium]|nr:hypothetical protein [Candidatus Polarisedimenticolaceae bacterium]
MVCAFASGSTSEARVTFDPSLFLTVETTDNVAFANSTQPKTSDSNATLGVTLPVRRETARGWLEFLYSTGFSRYREITAFDDINHLLEFRSYREPNPATRLNAEACYLRTQQQNRGYRVRSCTELFTTERTRRELFGGTVDYNRRLGRLWSWNVELQAAVANFDAIEDFDPGDTGLVVEDKVGYRASAGIARRFGRRLRLGTSYSYGVVFQDLSPDVETHRLRLDVEHEATRRLQYRLQVGAYYRSSDEVDEQMQDDLRTSGVEFLFELQYGESKGYRIGPVVLELGAGIQPTAGSGLQGTSTDAVVSAGLSPVRSQRWNWQFESTYGVRIPTESDAVDIRTLRGSAWIERELGRAFGARLRGYFSDQMADDPTYAVSLYIVEISLAWYFLRHR